MCVYAYAYLYVVVVVLRALKRKGLLKPVASDNDLFDGYTYHRGRMRGQHSHPHVQLTSC